MLYIPGHAPSADVHVLVLEEDNVHRLKQGDTVTFCSTAQGGLLDIRNPQNMILIIGYEKGEGIRRLKDLVAGGRSHEAYGFLQRGRQKQPHGPQGGLLRLLVNRDAQSHLVLVFEEGALEYVADGNPFLCSSPAIGGGGWLDVRHPQNFRLTIGVQNGEKYALAEELAGQGDFAAFMTLITEKEQRPS